MFFDGKSVAAGRTHSQRIDKLVQRRDGLVANASAALKANNDSVAREILKVTCTVCPSTRSTQYRVEVGDQVGLHQPDNCLKTRGRSLRFRLSV